MDDGRGDVFLSGSKPQRPVHRPSVSSQECPLSRDRESLRCGRRSRGRRVFEGSLSETGPFGLLDLSKEPSNLSFGLGMSPRTTSRAQITSRELRPCLTAPAGLWQADPHPALAHLRAALGCQERRAPSRDTKPAVVLQNRQTTRDRACAKQRTLGERGGEMKLKRGARQASGCTTVRAWRPRRASGTTARSDSVVPGRDAKSSGRFC